MKNETTAPTSRAAYKLTEVASLVGKKRGWAYRMVHEGKLPVIRGYGVLLVPATAVEAMLSNAKSTAQPEQGRGKDKK